MIKKLFFLSLLLVLSTSIHADTIKKISKEAVLQDFFQNLCVSEQEAAVPLASVEEQNVATGTISDSEKSQEVCEENPFYKKYLSKFYPKVFVIRENFFARMTPVHIAEGIANVVYIFSEKPWFYFFDKADGFKIAGYWEYVVDQCSFINEFLKKASVNLTTRRVFLPEKNGKLSEGIRKMGTGVKTKNLFLYLRDSGCTSVFDFYALSFDYLLKLFNEGILLKDFEMVDRYYYELDFVVKKLFKSKYEADYLEVMKTCKELMTLLKNKQQKDYDIFLDAQDGKKKAAGGYNDV